MAWKINSKLLKLKLFYFFQFAIFSVILIYIPPFMVKWGVTVTELALIQLVTQALTLFTRPYFGFIADKYQNYKKVIIFLSISCGVQFLLFLAVPKYVQPIDDFRLNTGFKVSEIDSSMIICNLNNSDNICWPSSLVHCSFNSSINYNFYISQNNWTCGVYQVFNQSQTGNFQEGTTFKCKNVVQNCNVSDVNLFSPISKNIKLTWSTTFWILGSLKILSYSTYSPISNLGDSLVFMVLGKEKSSEFGFTRMFGTIGVLVFAIITGITFQCIHLLVTTYKYNWLVQIQSYSPFTVCFFLQMIILGTVILITHFIKYEKPNEDKQSTKGQSYVSKFVAMMSFELMYRNLEMTVFFIFSIFGGLILSITVEYYMIIIFKMFPDMPKYVPSLIIVTATLSESIFMGFTGKVLKHFSYEFVIAFGFLIWSIRFLLYAFCTKYWHFLILELLHGPSYGLQFSTMVSFVGNAASKSTQGRSQGLFSGIYYNLGGGIGGLIGGLILGHTGSSGLFKVMFVLSLVCAILYYPFQVWIIPRYFNRSILKGEDYSDKSDHLVINS